MWIFGESIISRRKSIYKGFEVGICFVNLKNRKECGSVRRSLGKFLFRRDF